MERLSRKRKILGNICSFEQLFYRKKSLGAPDELKCLHESKNILCIYGTLKLKSIVVTSEADEQNVVYIPPNFPFLSSKIK